LLAEVSVIIFSVKREWEICPFCKPDKKRIVYEGDYSFALLDLYPVSRGHTLVIPKRHVESIDELEDIEWMDIVRTLKVIKRGLKDLLKPDGFNIGFNLGEAAGQSIPHIHIHIIPRYAGDTRFPLGGIRRVVFDIRDDILHLKKRCEENRLTEDEIEFFKEKLFDNE